MKALLYLTLLLIGLPAQLVHPQVNDNINCATTPLRGEVIDLQQNGGIYLTSQGELKVLVVFVKFRDDHSAHNYWPDTMIPQPFMTTYIDPSWQTNSTNEINLTHYFRKMSLGIFKVTGEYVYVETPHDKSYYGNPPSRSLATKEVLQQKVDPLINFANYDNWTCNGSYNQTNQPDGTVDMIIVIWRGQPFNSSWGGEASLGGGSSYTVENGTKTIKTYFGCGIGSGVTVQDVANKWLKYNFHSSVHEIAHWLLGSSHPYSGSITHRAWGMLRGGFDGICANAYERERVAWINPTPITGDILNAPFTDYVETGVAYKYHPTNGATNEYYYFENHQKLNVYCDATRNPNDKGIFVYHLQGLYSESDNNRCKTSNVQFNWNDPFTTNCWGNTLPAFKMISVNRNGYNNMDKIPKTGGGSELLYALINENGAAVCGGWPWGEGLNNSFNLVYNDVFSPKSNPNTNTWSNQPTSFTMEIFDQYAFTVNAKFYLADPYAGKPSKPQWLQIQESQNHHPYLSWDANQEPDMLTGGKYNVYKKKYISGSWTWNYLAQTSNNYYEDATEDYCPPPPTQCENPNNIYYRVKAIDSQLKESVYSDSIKAVVNGGPPDKISVDTPSTGKPTEYSLMQNYPNPFNPTTTISYTIPKNGLITLKIYDILGTEVAELVNESQEAGKYLVTFNASELPSGIYFYTLTSGNFTATKKLILLK
jgi:hypothetical protein